MPRKHGTEIFITLLLVAYFIFGYMPIADFNQARGIYHTLGLPGEERLPFFAPFILGYGLVYGSVFLIYWSIPNWEVFKKMAWGFFWVTTVHYIFFFLYPVKMVWRPEIVEAKNTIEWITKFIFSLDNTYNCFPSLHVAYPTLATVISWRFAPRMRYIFLLMTLITAISVILIKQHYILDVLGGMATSVLVGVLTLRKSKCVSV